MFAGISFFRSSQSVTGPGAGEQQGADAVADADVGLHLADAGVPVEEADLVLRRVVAVDVGVGVRAVADVEARLGVPGGLVAVEGGALGGEAGGAVPAVVGELAVVHLQVLGGDGDQPVAGRAGDGDAADADPAHPVAGLEGLEVDLAEDADAGHAVGLGALQGVAAGRCGPGGRDDRAVAEQRDAVLLDGDRLVDVPGGMRIVSPGFAASTAAWMLKPSCGPRFLPSSAAAGPATPTATRAAVDATARRRALRMCMGAPRMWAPGPPVGGRRCPPPRRP
ncbi:hypothetical protein [Blastococcus sp. DSM 46786]|uniref:hypothetical protein n=1 Tax=Blastococcus sp. DSM 46786 TaxID=1798227 RepID=UPI001FCE0948|nr:hypothetical protein [Blastococcus sp. DSM 46786]